MANYFSSDFTLGILGGGQLGKMLLCETRKYDIRTRVLDPNENSPCRIACNEFLQGDLMDFDTVYDFGKYADLLTIEIENINVEALERLEADGVAVHPSPKTIRIVRDKGLQKQFYKTHHIPTSPFIRFEDKYSLQEALLRKTLHFPFVWKSCTGGYDGRGVSVIRDDDDLVPLPEGSCIAEKLIDFQTELAVTVARTPSGKQAVYPVVEMEFHPTANQVEYVLCPARIDAAIAEKATEIALGVSNALEHTGLLAVEMFLCKNGDILVNEVAPRPHNSGHFSIEACYTNQFEQHLRAILDLPPGSTALKTAAVMVNLAGASGHTGLPFYENIEKIMAMPGVTPHIYGKRQTRPFRKMGHVTITDEDILQARKTAEKVKDTIVVKSMGNVVSSGTHSSFKFNI